MKKGLLILIAFLILIVGLMAYFKHNEFFSSFEEKKSENLEINEQTVIGYIGCSNTRQTVYGYDLLGGEEIWEVNRDNVHDYDSGSVRNWAKDSEESNEFWKIFDQELERNPNTRKIWWQLCIPSGEVEITYEQALIVAEILRNKIPNLEIYVSPLAEYTENICEITGVEGIERAKSLALELDSKNEDIFLGPVLGPLVLDEIMVQERDRCHPNEKGMEKMGAQLKEFFEGKLLNDTVIKVAEKTETRLYDERVEKAFEEIDCPLSNINLGSTYYTGKLIDTHIHMSEIPDDINEEFDEDEVQPILGINVWIDSYICMMNYEKTSKVFAFFSVWEPIILESLEVVKRTMMKYPDKFVPFIMPPYNDDDKDGYPTVDAEALDSMLSIYPGLFKGYGEIGLYARGDHGGATGAPALPPDSERLREIYPIIRKHNLTVYFHLGEGQKESFEKILDENKDINFIWHGDQLVAYGNNGKQDLSKIADILTKHSNAYYGVDELYGDEWILRPEVGKEKFLAHFGNYKPLIEEDLATWKEFIEKHSDQVLWGTDRGGIAVWSLDSDVAETLNNYSRYFIAQLEPDVQEKFAYKNAEKLFS